MGNCKCCQSHLNEPTLTTKASVPDPIALDMCNAKLLKLADLALSTQSYKINEIDFTSKHLSREEQGVLEAILHHFCHIFSLQLSSTSLSSKTWGDFPITLSAFTNLSILDLSHNYIGPLGAEKLSISLEKMTKLESLLLTEVGLESTGMILICGGIVNKKNLKILSIGKNNIGNLGVKMLNNIISHIPELIFFDIHDNSISENYSHFIGNCVSQLKKLKVLKVGGNCLQKKGGNILISSLPCGLEELWMENTGIEDSHMEKLAECTMSLQQLNTLSLDDNLIGPRGAQSLTEILSKTNIKHLSLINCEVSSHRKAFSFGCATTEILL